MRSFTTTLAVVIALACTAAPALAVPAAPDTSTRSTPAQVAPPAQPSDGGTATVVYALIAAGGCLALGGGGFLGARSVASRQVRPHAS
jgi:hypothetical protein